MDFNFNNAMNPYNRATFYSVEGIIVNMEPARIGNRRTNGCRLFVTIENMDGNIINFIVTASTYVIDYATLQEGMQCTFYYRADAPAPLIYPPQYTAAVVDTQRKNGQFVSVGYFNASLVNENNTLRLNLDKSVKVMTTNNQIFLGNPANHNLVVFYETSTRSIPAQTTPTKITVLCNE